MLWYFCISFTILDFKLINFTLSVLPTVHKSQAPPGETGSVWSMDTGSSENHSPVYSLSCTVMRFCVMWVGLPLSHLTKFCNCQTELTHLTNPRMHLCHIPEAENATFCNRNVHVCTFITKWCIVGYLSDALWDLCDGSIVASISSLIHESGLILGLRPANERRRYFVTSSFIGWGQA